MKFPIELAVFKNKKKFSQAKNVETNRKETQNANFLWCFAFLSVYLFWIEIGCSR